MTFINKIKIVTVMHLTLHYKDNKCIWIIISKMFFLYQGTDTSRGTVNENFQMGTSSLGEAVPSKVGYAFQHLSNIIERHFN